MSEKSVYFSEGVKDIGKKSLNVIVPEEAVTLFTSILKISFKIETQINPPYIRIVKQADSAPQLKFPGHFTFGSRFQIDFSSLVARKQRRQQRILKHTLAFENHLQ